MAANILLPQRFRDIVVIGMLLALGNAATRVTPGLPHRPVSVPAR
jgi:hypothetical protein